MVRLQQCALALGLLITTSIGHAVEHRHSERWDFADDNNEWRS